MIKKMKEQLPDAFVQQMDSYYKIAFEADQQSEFALENTMLKKVSMHTLCAPA